MPGAKDCKGVALRNCNGNSAWQTESTCPFVCMEWDVYRQLHTRRNAMRSRHGEGLLEAGRMEHGHSVQLGLRRARLHGFVQTGRAAMHRHEPSDLQRARQMARHRGLRLRMRRHGVHGDFVPPTIVNATETSRRFVPRRAYGPTMEPRALTSATTACAGAPAKKGQPSVRGTSRKLCTAGQWKAQAPCANLCVSTATSGACGGVCKPGDTKCTGGSLQTCDKTGAWTGALCPFVCSDPTATAPAACTGVCTPGTTKCNGNTQQLCSPEGQWTDAQVCPYVCTSGACGGLCVPGQKQCSNGSPQNCDTTGKWVTGTKCPFVCSVGGCAGVCVPGSKQCSGKTPQTCSADGTWVSAASSCSDACIGAGTCVDCTPNDKRCSGTQSQQCDATGHWTNGTLCPNVCSAGDCTGSVSPGGDAVQRKHAADLRGRRQIQRRHRLPFALRAQWHVRDPPAEEQALLGEGASNVQRRRTGVDERRGVPVRLRQHQRELHRRLLAGWRPAAMATFPRRAMPAVNGSKVQLPAPRSASTNRFARTAHQARFSALGNSRSFATRAATGATQARHAPTFAKPEVCTGYVHRAVSNAARRATSR